MLREMLEKHLVEAAGVAPEVLQDKGKLIGELGLDSLSVVEMLFEVEGRYGFHIEDAMKYKEMTLDEVIADLERLVEKHAARTSEPTGPEPGASPHA